MYFIMLNKLAFYTVFMGNNSNWANIVPNRPPLEFDSYFYTNNLDTFNQATNKGWTTIFVDKEIQPNDVESAMDAKIFKACPHLLDELKNYEFTCYLDTKIVITDYTKIITIITNIENNILYAIPKHPYEYHSVWDEFNLAMGVAKYRLQKDKSEMYIKKNLVNGYFQEYIPHHFTTQFIIRKNSELTSQMNEMWYNHIVDCGIECQISFSFIQQIYANNILPLDNKCCYYNL